MTLSQLRPGQRATIVVPPEALGVGDRLLDFGFVRGAPLEVLSEAPFGGDPILVRIHETRVAIRRSDAAQIVVELINGAVL